MVRVRLCPRLVPPSAGEPILHSPSGLEDAPGKESEVWWCRQLLVLCLDLCLVVPSEQPVCRDEMSVGNVCCLDIDSLWPVEIVESSWKGFLLKMF